MTRDANDSNRRRRHEQSERLGKVTVSWSIVFVLPMDQRGELLSLLLRRGKSIERLESVIRRLRDGYRGARLGQPIISELTLTSLSPPSPPFYLSPLSLDGESPGDSGNWRGGRVSKAKFRSSTTTTSVPRHNATRYI
ncbi:hypothetical protein PUN28_008440 [Cardiocondyla obscurior]|uniref:Uncharacterized protein n=1 Tax=Cardiocondyla obscurior TaxID=286306 RepID=A0AAW2FZE4_9HYME